MELLASRAPSSSSDVHPATAQTSSPIAHSANVVRRAFPHRRRTLAGWIGTDHWTSVEGGMRTSIATTRHRRAASEETRPACDKRRTQPRPWTAHAALRHRSRQHPSRSPPQVEPRWVSELKFFAWRCASSPCIWEESLRLRGTCGDRYSVWGRWSSQFRRSASDAGLHAMQMWILRLVRPSWRTS